MPGQGTAAGGQGGRDRLRLFTQDPVSRCRAWGGGAGRVTVSPSSLCITLQNDAAICAVIFK